MIGFLKNKTILITGGAGFIGSNLADEIIKFNVKKLFIIDNLSQSNIKNIDNLLKDKKVEFIKEDIRNYNEIESYILKSDYIFHLAAEDVGNSIINPKSNIETNILGTLNILNAMLKKPEIKMVYVSSGSVVNPSTIYAISKLTAEQSIKYFNKEYGLKISIIRPHHVFGQRQNIFGTSGVINKFLFKVLNYESPIIWGNGYQIKNFTYVLDVVNAIILLAEKDESIGNIYDVASDIKINIKDLAELLIIKYSIDKEMKPIYSKSKIGENMQLFPKTTDIKKLGWNVGYDFEHGLDISKQWVEKQINNKN